jgi:hypothetical protein
MNVIKILRVCRTEFLDFGYVILNPVHESSWQGLFWRLPDREEVIPNIEACPRTLLEVSGSKGGLNLDCIIMNNIYLCAIKLN